jgi:hypothetical protein
LLSVGSRPALIPGLLLVGALVAFLLPDPWWRTRRLVAVAVLVLAGWAALSIAPLTSSGPVVTSFGDAVPGVPLVLRADQTGLALVVISLAAALVTLGAADRRLGEEAAVLVVAAGTALAALAGNAVILFGGAEIASLGGLLLASVGRGRVSRGAVAAFSIQHVVALGLLVAAVQLVVATGTSDPYAVPQSVVGLSVALPWGLAGAGRLLAAGWWPRTAGGRSARSWLVIGAVPCGAAILLRLAAATGGGDDLGLTLLLTIVGAAAALWGAVAAWRWRHESRRAGRALLTASAGALVAVAGLPGGAGGFAAGLVALELALLASPAWSQPTRPSRRGRALAAAALAAAGGLPLGFGTTAAVLELGTVATLGRAYTPLLLALGAAAVGAAASGLVAARQALGPAAFSTREVGLGLRSPDREEGSLLRGSGPLLSTGPSAEEGTGPRILLRGVVLPRPDAVLALALGAIAALLPGGVGAAVLGPLVGSSAPAVIDAATLHGPGGPWPGGYLSLALLIVLVAVASAGLLMGRPVPHPAHGERGPRPRPAWLTLVRIRRTFGPPVRSLGRGLARTDAWLVAQPGLAFTVVAALAALIVFRYI